MLNQDESRLKQLEQHSIHPIGQEAERKLGSLKRAERIDHTSLIGLMYLKPKRMKMAMISVLYKDVRLLE